jgi:hypothetical protein
MAVSKPGDMPNVLEANEHDLEAALEGAVSRSGFTVDQLREQAGRRHFETIRARLAWVAVGDLITKAAGH